MAPKRKNQGAKSTNNMFARNSSLADKDYNPMAGSEDSLGRDLISSNKRSSSSFENDIPRDPKGRRTGSVTSDDENASDDENDADSIEDQIVESSNCPSKSPSNSSMPSTPSITSTPSMSSPPSMVSSLSMSSRSSTNSTAETTNAQMIIHISSAVFMKDLEIGKVNILVMVVYLIGHLFFIRT